MWKGIVAKQQLYGMGAARTGRSASSFIFFSSSKSPASGSLSLEGEPSGGHIKEVLGMLRSLGDYAQCRIASLLAAS